MDYGEQGRKHFTMNGRNMELVLSPETSVTGTVGIAFGIKTGRFALHGNDLYLYQRDIVLKIFSTIEVKKGF